MNHASIPDDVRRFVLQCVPSVPYLEAVLLLRENRAMVWLPTQVAKRLYLPDVVAARLLERLRHAGVVALDSDNADGYCYSPRTAELAEIWDKVAYTYSHHLISISTLIHQRSSAKAHLLADAFVWKKDN